MIRVEIQKWGQSLDDLTLQELPGPVLEALQGEESARRNRNACLPATPTSPKDDD